VVVARPTKWGNPVRFARDRDGRFVVTAPWLSRTIGCDDERTARRVAADALAEHLAERRREPGSRGYYPSDDEIRAELGGRDLACWCPLDQPCHADVLLTIANDAKVKDDVSFFSRSDRGS